MNGKQLKNSILQWAIQGKLVPQDPNDEPASVLLDKIRAEKARLVKEKKIKKDKNESIIYKGDDNSYYEKILATGEIKCIDEEIPFEIPATWKWCRLRDIAEVKGGKRLPAGCKLSDEKTGHIYIRVSDMRDGTIIDNDLKYISEEVYNLIRNYTINKEDLYLTIVGSTIGKAGYVPSMFDKMNLTENAVKLTHIYFNRLYLLVYIQSEFAQVQFRDKTKQVGQPKLAIYRIENTLIPLPPLKEQHRIVAKLEELLPIIEKYNHSQKALDQLNLGINDKLRKSILQEAIQGKLVPQIENEGTAQELLEQIKQEKQRLVKEGKLKKQALTDSVIYKGDDNKYYEQIGQTITCIDEQLPFELPSSWQWCKMGDISFVYTGNSISETEKRAKYTGVKGREYIGTKDISYNHSITYNNGIAIPEKYESAFRIAPANSVLMCIEGGSAGRKIGITDRDICFGNKLCCFNPFVEISMYLFDYLQSPSFFDMFISGKTGIIGGVSVNNVKQLFIPLPPLKEQERIVEKINNIFDKIKG